MRFDRATAQPGLAITGIRELRGQRREQGRVDLRVAAPECDQGIIAQAW